MAPDPLPSKKVIVKNRCEIQGGGQEMTDSKLMANNNSGECMISHKFVKLSL